MWCKSMTAYFNSSLGIVSMLGVRIPRKPLYPRFSVENHASIPVPNMDEKAMDILAHAYDNNAVKRIGEWKCRDDPVRKVLDVAVSKALGVDVKVTSEVRTHLSREPMCVG